MPYYDFECADCGVTEVKRSMADAGNPAYCPTCGVSMRRLYDTTIPVMMRPWGYSLRHDDPKFWDGFSDPLPEKQSWQRGRGTTKSSPGPEAEGFGDLPYKA